MKVFLSWSKDSKQFAAALDRAMRQLFDAVETFFSQEIPAGERWLTEIEDNLSSTDFGIICVTKSNQTEQWLNFEAGALSRQVGDRRKRLGVLLLDFEDKSDVKGPFATFQMKLAEAEEFGSLMRSINEIGPNIPIDVLENRITLVWPSLQATLDQLKSTSASARAPQRSTEDKIDELLSLVRTLDRVTTAPVIAPFVTSADDRQKGRELIAKLYKMMKGQEVHFDFRPLTESIDVLDVSTAVSTSDHTSIKAFHRSYFPNNELIISDVAFRNGLMLQSIQDEQVSTTGSAMRAVDNVVSSMEADPQ